jgi:hypothetical protein
MAWIAPKTDWAPTDGVTDADLNRVEGNTVALRRLIHVGGSPHEVSFIDQNQTMQKTYISIPANHKIVLVRANLFLGATYSNAARALLLIRGKQVGQETTSSWTLNSGPDYEALDSVYSGSGLDLGGNFSNSTGSAVGMTLEVRLGTTGGGYTISNLTTSWQLVFDIVPV